MHSFWALPLPSIKCLETLWPKCTPPGQKACRCPGTRPCWATQLGSQDGAEGGPCPSEQPSLEAGSSGMVKRAAVSNQQEGGGARGEFHSLTVKRKTKTRETLPTVPGCPDVTQGETPFSWNSCVLGRQRRQAGREGAHLARGSLQASLGLPADRHFGLPQAVGYC